MRYTIHGVRNDFSFCETEETVVSYQHLEPSQLLEHIMVAFANKQVMWVTIDKEDEENGAPHDLQP